jgi:thiol peroxidase
MAKITLEGKPVETIGELPAVNTMAPGFRLTKTDFSDVTLQDFAGRRVILNIFLSVDTAVCATSVRRFNAAANKMENTAVLCISADLPYAHKRFCTADGLENVIPLSVFRSRYFGRDYGVEIASGPLAGLLSRAIVIIDESGKIIYTEQVPEISQEPDYDAALAAAGKS